MESLSCPKCGHQTTAGTVTCPDCGHALNGKLPVGDRPAEIPDGRLPPEWCDWESQAFDKQAFLHGVAEVERTGGVELKDFIQEIYCTTLTVTRDPFSPVR
jgi:hypothetical protein